MTDKLDISVLLGSVETGDCGNQGFIMKKTVNGDIIDFRIEKCPGCKSCEKDIEDVKEEGE